jgi:hypothetical protein
VGYSVRPQYDEFFGAVRSLQQKVATLERSPSGANTIGPKHLAVVPSAKVLRNTPQSLTSGSLDVISWNLENRDNAGLFDPATPTKITAPIAGLWLCEAQIRWTSNATGTRLLILSTNGSGSVENDRPASATPWNSAQSVFGVFRLTAGQFIQVEALQNSGGALDVLGDAATFMGMTWLGNGV